MKVTVVLAVAVLFCLCASGTLSEKTEPALLNLKNFEKPKDSGAKLTEPKGYSTQRVWGPSKPQEGLQLGAAKRNAEVLLTEKLYMTVKEGSFGWFGYGKNNFIPPVYVDDPYWKFAETGWSALLIGNFKGPYGHLSYALYSLQGTLTLPDGQRLETGRITQSWASHPMYCGPEGPFADPCTPTVWKYETRSNGCKDLTIYDPDNLKTPLLNVTGMCVIPGLYFPTPNTTWYLPRESAFRLFAMDLLTYIVDGVGTDGRPHFTQRALFDFDMEGIMVPATYERVEGSAVGNFTQYLIPLGFSALPGGSVRTGVFSISPNQGTFANLTGS
eukprot:jgi/Botrbrau1/19491/Bobra.0880s0003.1